MTLNDLTAAIRFRVNDSDKINYSDAELVEDLATACRLLSLALIARKSPEMIVTAPVVDYTAVPGTFHSFAGQYPVWRDGNVFRTATGNSSVNVRYYAVRGNGLSSLTDTFPFDDGYRDVVSMITSELLLNRDEFDVTFEQSLAQKIEDWLPQNGAAL